MNLTQLLDRLENTPSFMENVVHWEKIPAKEAVYEPFPSSLNPGIAPVLASRGIYRLYSHQRKAFDRIEEGKNV